ncbi:MAG TPA: SCO family protein [Candidatus Baltobacteraceae bacterium]|nr:SCO family protein [Candidatus Baltobacteraceae bacterium]
MALAATLPLAIAFAHPARVAGLVVSVLAKQHAVVVLRDAEGSAPQQTTLYRLSPRVSVSTLHAGDRIVGLVDADTRPVVLDEVRVTPPPPPRSIIRNVIPLFVGDQMPDTKFVDQRGRPFSIADFRGKSVVLSFIYSRCADQAECPLISSHFHVLQQRFANGPYHLIEMTLDPGYDRPSILARYGRRFGADPTHWTIATGDPETVLDFDARFGIDPFADPRVGLIHTERTVLIDPSGKIFDFIDLPGWNPDDIVARLQAFERHPSDLLSLLDFELSKATVAICGNGASGFNGLEDLAIILAILGSVAFVLQRVASFIFRRENVQG